MTERRRLGLLIGVMVCVVLISGGITFVTLYHAAVESQRARLVDSVKALTRLIEAVARHDRQHSKRHPEGALGATLSQVIAAHKQTKGFGRTGEFVLAQRNGDHIDFLLSQRHDDDDEPEPAPYRSRLAKPMRLALQGKSGSLIGPDYRGVMVLAAYEPVAVLNMGAVTKIDLAEVRAPFLRGAAVGGLGALLAILITAVLFIRNTRPLIERAEQQTRYQSQLVDTASDAIISTDTDFRVLTWNEAACRIYGWSSEDVLGQSVLPLFQTEYLSGEDREAVIEELRSEGKWQGEVRHRTKDGSLLDVLSAVSQISDGSGRTIGYVAVNRDVTDLKRLEEDYRQAQKMEAVGRLASGIAHDFKNLLMGIGGCADIARGQVEAATPAADALAQIKQAVTRGDLLAKQLLAFSRRDQQLGLEVLLFDREVHTAAKLLKRLLTPSVTLDLQLQANGAQVSANIGQLNQLLMNLALNARDAMAQGGKLTVSSDDLTVDPSESQRKTALPPGHYLRLMVSDEGTGMDAETQSRAFEPFFTTKQGEGGTGLGLSIVYGIVQQWQGHVRLDSVADRGTTVSIYLPIVAMEVGAAESVVADQAAAPSPETTHSAEIPGAEVLQLRPGGADGGSNQSTIVVIEDDPAVRLAVKHYLVENGYRAFTMNNGDEALRFCRKYREPIDLLLTDVVLPGANGVQVAEEIRNIRPEAKIIYISAHPGAAFAGRDDLDFKKNFIEKPFTATALLDRIQSVLA